MNSVGILRQAHEYMVAILTIDSIHVSTRAAIYAGLMHVSELGLYLVQL